MSTTTTCYNTNEGSEEKEGVLIMTTTVLYAVGNCQGWGANSLLKLG